MTNLSYTHQNKVINAYLKYYTPFLIKSLQTVDYALVLFSKSITPAKEVEHPFFLPLSIRHFPH
jgi:hypothetical protein